MMTVTLYEVIGSTPYRGHPPGTRFTARLEPAPERRAVARGNIRVIDTLVPALPPEHSLPPGWADQSSPTEAPAGASLVEGSR